MKRISLLIKIVVIGIIAVAQIDVPASGNNPRAMVSEEVGITSITIKYGRPDVNKREGEILMHKKQISEEYGYMALMLDTEGNRIALHSVPEKYL